MTGIVILLCNETDYAAIPWVVGGYNVYMIDPNHPSGTHQHKYLSNVITIGNTILDSLWLIGDLIRTGRVAMVIGFPPCDDLSGCGARWWVGKLRKNRYFQHQAALVLEQCRMIGALSGAPWMFENPRGAASGIIGPPSFTFNPSDYGGYLSEDDMHPDWPEIIPPRDGYPKLTYIWSGGGFIEPPRLPVPSIKDFPGWKLLGGKSKRTKQIRGATPRGFSQAVYESNRPPKIKAVV